MEKQYYYITVDGQDGSAFTLWFADKGTQILWFELNEQSQNSNYVLDDGFLVVEGKINSAFIMTEMNVRERFMEENA